MLPKKHYWAIGLFVGIAERERAANRTAGTWRLIAWTSSEARRTEESKHHAKGTSTQFHARFRLSKLPDSQQAPDSKVLGAEMTCSVQGVLECCGSFVRVQSVSGTCSMSTGLICSWIFLDSVNAALDASDLLNVRTNGSLEVRISCLEATSVT